MSGLDLRILPDECELLRQHAVTAEAIASLPAASDGSLLIGSNSERWATVDAGSELFLAVGVAKDGQLTKEGVVIMGLIERIFPR